MDDGANAHHVQPEPCCHRGFQYDDPVEPVQQGTSAESKSWGNELSRREKLLAKMRNSPQSIRFGEVQSLLSYEGFVLFNRRGSHCTFHRADGRLLTIVRPHASRSTCHPNDIRRILEALER